MSHQTSNIKHLCEQAIERVDLAISNHKNGIPDDLSIPMLEQVRLDLVKMKEALSSAIFRPTYGRFVLDWPNEHGLVRILSDVEYQYSRLK